MKNNAYPKQYEELEAYFARLHGINIDADRGPNTHWVPKLAELDDSSTVSQHETAGGADYFFSRLDYYLKEDLPRLEGDATDDKPRAQASRMIAKILAHRRTELAYWALAAPEKRLTVHKGLGRLVIGDPRDGSTTITTIDNKVHRNYRFLRELSIHLKQHPIPQKL